MGAPVVHFEIAGTNAEAMWSFYSAMFGWDINNDNPMNYGIVDRTANSNSEGIGLGGGICAMPEGMPGYVTVYVEVPDVEASLQQAESLGGKRLMGPEKVMDSLEIGMFSDPDGHPFGLIKANA
jgi:predicted enzyme related to lactoylglutathione lyase